MSNRFSWFGRGLVFAYVVGHALAVISLVAFGLRAGGWMLHPLAVTWYAAFVAGCLFWLIRYRQDESLLVIPPLLMLCALAAFAITGALGGATYAPYGLFELDEHDLFLALNLMCGLALAALALLYHSKGLLRVGVLAQAILLLTYPVLWLAVVGSWVPGPNFLLTGIVAVGVELALVYALAGGVLADERGPAGRFPWEALVLALWFALSLAGPQLRVGTALPAAGTRLGGTQTIVPDAWLPTMLWAEWLFNLLLWLLVPYALLGLVIEIRRGSRWDRAVFAFPQVLLVAGLAWLALYARDYSPLGFPLRALRGLGPPSNLTLLLPLAGALALFAAARAWERKWGGPAELFWRALTLGSLSAFLIANAQGAGNYAQVLYNPPPEWERYGTLPPLAPAVLAIAGLLFQLALVAIGLVALAQVLRASLRANASRPAALARNLALPLLGIAMVVAFASWLLQPEVIRTVPPNGAVDVPRDTQIYVELGAEKPWVGLQNGTMAGIWADYAATGEPLQGTSGGSGLGKFMIQPAGLLRPEAVVEVVVFRSGEQPYTFHFQTTGRDGPAATPMPASAGFRGPVPTAPPATP